MVPWDKYGMEIVGEAQNGEQALAFLKEHAVDLILIDLEMPVMSGTELMKKARELYPGLMLSLIHI